MSIESVADHTANRADPASVTSVAERVDFLKHSIEFTEGSIRAYDTKSQIAMAAFVLSMSPLWSMLSATCPNAATRPIVAVLFGAFICTIMTYGSVLWPIRPLQDLIEKARAKGLFYIHDPVPVAATRDAGETERAVTTFSGASNGGLIVTASGLANVHRELIISLAERDRLPAIYFFRLFSAGGA